MACWTSFVNLFYDKGQCTKQMHYMITMLHFTFIYHFSTAIGVYPQLLTRKIVFHLQLIAAPQKQLCFVDRFLEPLHKKLSIKVALWSQDLGQDCGTYTVALCTVCSPLHTDMNVV